MVGKSAFEERDIRNVSAATQTHAYALITNLDPEQVQIRTFAQPFGDVGLNRAGANPKTRNTMLAEKMMDNRLVVWGSLIKFNQKTVSVLTEDGRRWKVSPQFLSPVIPEQCNERHRPPKEEIACSYLPSTTARDERLQTNVPVLCC